MQSIVLDLEPFRVSTFRRYLAASSLGFSSLWIYLTIVAWMLLELTSSAAVAGLLLVAMTIPVPFSMLAAGALTDRLGPRSIVAVAFGVQGLAALATALLVLFGRFDIPLVLLLALVLGTADGFVTVSSQVLAGRTVGPAAMSSAIALGMLAIGIGRIVGAPIGGSVTEMAGPAAGLLLAAIGFGTAAVLVLAIPRMDGIAGGARLSLGDLREGFAWVRATPAAKIVVALGVVAALFLWPYLGLLAAIVRDVLDGDPGTLGLITAAGGGGAMVAALIAGIAGRIFGPSNVLIAAVLCCGLLLVIFGLVSWIGISMLVSMMLSLGLVTFAAMVSVILQSLAPPDLRGRVLATNGFVVYGLMPISIVVAGVATDVWGASTVTVVMGTSAVGLVLAIMLVASRQRVYARLHQVVPAVESSAVVDGPAPTGGGGPVGLEP